MHILYVLLWAVALAVAVAGAVLVVSVVSIVVLMKLREKHALVRLAETPCPACGKPLGRQAALAAKEAFAAKMRDARRKKPDAKLWPLSHWPVRCTACGVKAVFRTETLDLTAC